MRFLRREVRKGLSERGDFWRDMNQPGEYQGKSILGRGSANAKALRHRGAGMFKKIPRDHEYGVE